MTIEDIKALIAPDEHRELEMKKSTGELKDGMHSACAFLNTEGGWLLFGIAPKSMNLIGQQVTDDTRREIAQALSGLEPALAVHIDYVEIPERPGNVIIAMHFDGWHWGETVYTYHGCPYYRVESTTKQMPREMFEDRLRASNPDKFAWDSQIAEVQGLDQIDEARLRTVVRQGIANGRITASAEGETKEALLGKLKLLKNGLLTNAAMALFANDTDDYPQLELRMGCFKGTDKTIFIDNKNASGNFFELLEAGIAFCFRNLKLSGVVVGLQRKERLEIPIEALREALTNSLCHRMFDRTNGTVSLAIYDDRLEIVNPGSLPAELSVEDMKLPHESYPRNKKIAQVLYQTTYLEKWGSGARRMIDACREQGVPEPEWKIGKGTVSVIFPRKETSSSVTTPDTTPDTTKEPQDRINEVLEYCRIPRSTKEILAHIGVSYHSKNVKKFVSDLVEKGLLRMTIPDIKYDMNQKYTTI